VNAAVNADFFYELLKDRQLSLRGLAKKIGLEPGALSLTFRGQRNMRLNEANEIAVILGVPLKEVLRNAGVENVSSGERTIPVIGVMRGSNVTTIDFNASLERVAGPPDLPEVAYAILAQTAMSDLAPFDGWLFFIGQPQQDARNLIGRSVFAKPAGEENAVYGFLSRSHKPGLFNLRHYVGQAREAIDIEWAAPVLWIRPQ
jgi:transcriptional regulator with XRE-family HTH domain